MNNYVYILKQNNITIQNAYCGTNLYNQKMRK